MVQHLAGAVLDRRRHAPSGPDEPDVWLHAGDLSPWAGAGPLTFTGDMFVGAETVLDVAFAEARARLAAAADGGWLRSASGDAYGEWGAGLARVGPPGSARTMARLVNVRFTGLSARTRSAVLMLRWEAAGPGGALFPVLDADLTLAPYGEPATLLALAGVYRPPLGTVDGALDRVVLRQVATDTIQGFVNQVGDAIARLPVRERAV